MVKYTKRSIYKKTKNGKKPRISKTKNGKKPRISKTNYFKKNKINRKRTNKPTKKIKRRKGMVGGNQEWYREKDTDSYEIWKNNDHTYQRQQREISPNIHCTIYKRDGGIHCRRDDMDLPRRLLDKCGDYPDGFKCNEETPAARAYHDFNEYVEARAKAEAEARARAKAEAEARAKAEAGRANIEQLFSKVKTEQGQANIKQLLDKAFSRPPE
jgi:hypothetical protein